MRGRTQAQVGFSFPITAIVTGMKSFFREIGNLIVNKTVGAAEIDERMKLFLDVPLIGSQCLPGTDHVRQRRLLFYGKRVTGQVRDFEGKGLLQVLFPS